MEVHGGLQGKVAPYGSRECSERVSAMAVNAKNPYLSVVIPVFNEEENIRALVDRLFGVLKRLDQAFEVIFVDDGSRDGSLELLKKA